MRARNTISKRLLPWFEQYGRKHLPWQQHRNAYKVWISEIMLQQTQVNTVIPYYQRFMQRFPDIHTLAQATEDEVLTLWTGLGYYSRARNLHRSAKIIVNDYQSNMPSDSIALQALPGIGRSTAGAIASMAFHQPEAILDGNVKRVLSRLHMVAGWPGQHKVAEQLWQLAEHYTPTQHVANYTQAIMDLGATVCTRTQPKCPSCPLQKVCLAQQHQATTDYPHKKVRKALPIRTRYFLMLHNVAGEVLLEKRPPSGIWGSLWCFPECAMDQSPVHFCADQYGLAVQQQQAQPAFKHTFTHFQLEIYPLHLTVQPLADRCMDNKNFIWHDPTQTADYALPTPMVKLLQRLEMQYASNCTLCETEY